MYLNMHFITEYIFSWIKLSNIAALINSIDGLYEILSPKGITIVIIMGISFQLLS